MSAAVEVCDALRHNRSLRRLDLRVISLIQGIHLPVEHFLSIVENHPTL